MGRGASKGVKSAAPVGDFSYGGEIKNIETLKAIKDAQLYKEMKAAISRFSSALGIPERNVKLADIEGAYGVQVNEGGKSVGVYLNKRIYKGGTKASVEKQKKADYKSGWSTKTNKPVAHTITHELGHALWNSSLSGAKQKAAGIEIKRMYKAWSKDRRKSGYGKYSKTNVDEFWAETVTKAIHGKADKYTQKAKAIVKKYKL